MPHFVNFRLFSCLHRLKNLPFSTQQMGFASIADTLYSHLHKNDGNVEKSLSVVKAKLNPKCICEVLSRCYPEQSHLGIRFFIWAGFQCGYKHSAYMYKKACNLLGIGQNPQIIYRVIESYEAEGSLVTVKMFREVLRLCKEAELADIALWVLKKMENFNLNADTVMYNVVIRLYIKKGDIEMAEKLMKEMSCDDLCPNVITYMAMIEGFCNAGRLEDAHSMLKVMRLNGCSPNSVVFSAVLDGLCRSGYMGRALELLDEMEKEGGDCRPNVVTYTSMIQMFCKRGQWTEALNILDRMKAFGCFANRVTVNTLIESLCADGCMEEAYNLTDKFVVEHGVPYSDCYSSLVISLIRLKKLKEAEKVFREMLAGAVRPDGLSCSLLLKDLCMKGRVVDGFYLLDAIENMGCLSSIDSDIYSVLLVGLCQRSFLMEATKLAKIMLKKSIVLRPPYQDSAIAILSKSGEKDIVNNLIGTEKEH